MRHILILSILLYTPFGVSAQNEPTLDIIPNPFVDTTTIVFTLPATDTVSLIVYNLLGELVDSIIKEQLMLQGVQSIQYVGDTLPIGQYFVFLDVDTHLVSKKIVKAGQLTLGYQKEKFENTQFNIYPNPTTGQITLTNLPIEATRITVYNTLGVLVYDGEVNGSDNPVIDLTEFPRGMYYLQVIQEANNLRRKIIKL